MTFQSRRGRGGLPRTSTLEEVIDESNQHLQGRLNVTADLTLTANAASTTLADPRIGFTSGIYPMPLTANAAVELGNGTLFIPTATMKKGSAVIQHANNLQTDRTFRFLIIG